MNTYMKNIAKFGLVLSALVLAGCDDLLDKQPLTQFTNSNFWTSESNVETFANEFYGTFTAYGNNSGSGTFYFPTLNDNQAGRDFTDWTYKTVPATISLWTSNYKALRRANLMIEKVPDISSMDDASKNNWLGVARLYRALMHYQLVRAFGDIIYVDKVLNVTDEDKEGYIYAAREDRDEVMEKVLDDLNFAVENITMNSSSRTAFNAAVAQAIKAEICLYEGTFRKYRSSADGQKAADATGAQTWLNEAKTACLALMNNSMYALNKSYQGNYNSVDLKDNTEMILYKEYIYGVLGHSLIDYTCSSTQISGMNRAAFDAYLFTDGEAKANTSLDATDHPVFNAKDSTLTIDNLLSVRDPRLAASIDATLMPVGLGYTRFGVGMESTSSTGYGICKYDNAAIDVNFRNQTSSNETDAPVYWLAVIYLNYAEACAELGTCTQSDLDKSINLLRDRVGMPHMTVSPKADPANNMGVSDLIWEIRRERRVELMFDANDRYWSLIRWHQLDKLDSVDYPEILEGAYVAESPKVEASVTSEGYVDASKGLTRTYDSKHYLYPVPSGQIDLYEAAGKTLSQNPGW